MNNMGNIQLPWPEWTIVKELGHGGYGVVYEAERELSGTKEKSAIKVISFPRSRQEMDADLLDGYDMNSLKNKYQEQLQGYVNEYKLMMQLKGNTNIVNCDDFASLPHADGVGWDVFIRMELLTPLTKVLRTKKLNEQEIIKLGKDICRALILCESVNIIHRDIKPGNIMVSQFGDFKLGDFGIARTMDHTMQATMTGTAAYMAPEVVHSEPYGKAVDIYSLGMVLYWLLNNGRYPFIDPDTVPNAAQLHASQTKRLRGDVLPPPRGGNPALKNVVLKACAYFPKDRYATAKDMYNALVSAERSIGTAAGDAYYAYGSGNGQSNGTGSRQHSQAGGYSPAKGTGRPKNPANSTGGQFGYTNSGSFGQPAYSGAGQQSNPSYAGAGGSAGRNGYPPYVGTGQFTNPTSGAGGPGPYSQCSAPGEQKQGALDVTRLSPGMSQKDFIRLPEMKKTRGLFTASAIVMIISGLFEFVTVGQLAELEAAYSLNLDGYMAIFAIFAILDIGIGIAILVSKAPALVIAAAVVSAITVIAAVILGGSVGAGIVVIVLALIAAIDFNKKWKEYENYQRQWSGRRQV